MRKKDSIYVKCPDGFINQLRLGLAIDYLMEHDIIKTGVQEWVINNHNIVAYDKFFLPLPHIQFRKITNQEEKENQIVTTCSFQWLVEKYGEPKKILKYSSHKIKTMPFVENVVNNFIRVNNIKDCLGVHIRTGCKTALLSQESNRNKPVSHKAIIDILKQRSEQIYLATDNAQTQSKFLDIFKERIICFDLLYDGLENFQGEYDRHKVKRYTNDWHVIMDFFTLQHCKKFIGSNESSFSIMIKWLRDNSSDFFAKGVI